MNPYESGAAVALEINEKRNWFPSASLVLAGLATCSVVAFFLYISLNVKQIQAGEMPSFALIMSVIGAWLLCSVLGVLFGAIGLLPGRGRRGIALAGLSWSLAMLLSMVGLFLYGKSIGF